MIERLQGIFPVLQTPVDADGEIIVEDLRKQIAFCIRAGAHGLVFPVLGSEFQFLTETERRTLVEVVITEASGQIPVVAGVAGAVKQAAVEMARHAAQAGADALIALPPYLAPASQPEIMDYYRAVAAAAGDLPVFIQHSNPGMDPPFLLRLLEQIPNVLYIKEEMHPSAHNISAVLEKVGDACLGVFGGAFNRWMLSELDRGATGFMPAAEVTDVHVQIWDAYQAGDESEARRLFNQVLPLINLGLILGLPVIKEVLVMRGVFRSAAMRTPGQMPMDAGDRRELEQILRDLEPLFRV